MPSSPFDILIPIAAAPFIGSFLTVLAVRLPKGEDVLIRRSHCRNCNRALRPFELVPLVSWLALKGRCAHCGDRISALYPVLEIAAIGVAAWATFIMDGALLWVTVTLGWVLLALIAMDIREFILSDVLTLPLIVAGIAAIAVIDPTQLWLHIVGAIAGFALMVGVALAYRVIRKQDGLGLGDAKLMAAAGAWTGVQGLGTVLLYAVAIGLVLALLLRVQGQGLAATTPIPFGAGVAAGLWLVWLYGPLLFTT